MLLQNKSHFFWDTERFKKIKTMGRKIVKTLLGVQNGNHQWCAI